MMQENSISFRLLLSKALRYWYLFALIFPMTVALAIFYLYRTPFQYEAEAMLLVKDEEKSGQLVEQALFDEFGLAGKNKKTLENEALILRSTPLMEKVVQKLELQYEYVAVEYMRKRELYKNSPVQVVAWKPNEGVDFAELELNIEPNGRFRIKNEYREYQGEFGKDVQLAEGRLILSHVNSKSTNGPLLIRLYSPLFKARELAATVDVASMGELSSTLKLGMRDVAPRRAEAILNELIAVYNQQSIDEKNEVFKSSLTLLNERIELITRELASAELDVEQYKQQFNLMGLSTEGTMLLQELANYNKEITGTDVQLEILNSIEDFLVKNKDSFEFVPTNLNINNLTMTNQLTGFNDLLKERERQRGLLGPSHPDLLLTEKQIRNLRQSIIDNIRSIKSDIQIGHKAKKELSANVENRMYSLPRRERELVDIERRKDIKENLYLYLLQKREQSTISLAVTAATGKVVEPAASSDPVSPKRAQILLIALFLGLAIPAGLAYLLYSMNDTVQMEDDLQRMTASPVAGILIDSGKKAQLAIKENSNSAAAEMFRLLRANLTYITPGHDLKVMIVTSGTSGEGKSYVALNFGVTQALTGKRVVLVELDLRKPNQAINGLNGAREGKGVVDYLVDPTMKIDKIIHNSGLNLNFDVIKCGPKPPNPGELILSPRLREMVEALKKRYDFIILDTPPVGLVADALQIKDMAEATMFVVRAGYTRKSHLNVIREIAQKEKLPRPFIVLNGVRFSKAENGYYGYSAGHKAGYYR
jgi:tyrosine-protein kinase Etk/Wzc